jgi:hypothetical protein
MQLLNLAFWDGCLNFSTDLLFFGGGWEVGQILRFEFRVSHLLDRYTTT